MQNPQLVHLSFIVGLNNPINSIASSKQGSLQEKHIVFCQAKHDNTSISILASICFYFLKLKHHQSKKWHTNQVCAT